MVEARRLGHDQELDGFLRFIEKLAHLSFYSTSGRDISCPSAATPSPSRPVIVGAEEQDS
jgi:hypothetical protein